MVKVQILMHMGIYYCILANTSVYMHQTKRTEMDK